MSGRPPIKAFKIEEKKQTNDNDDDSSDDEEEGKDVMDNLSLNENEFKIPMMNMGNPNKTVNNSPKEWNECFDRIEYYKNEIPIYYAGDAGTIFFCLHGAGHSALSFAMLAAILKKNYRLIAFDFRGHGENKQEDPTNLAKQTLINDTKEVLEYLITNEPSSSIVIVGHSMGGAIATQLACVIEEEEVLIKNVTGLIVLDVVEGSALEALPFMETIVQNKPSEFKNIESAIQWSIRSNTVKNRESARISIPSQLKQITTNNVAKYTWKVDLLQSKEYWEEWFIGLTKAFLDYKKPKILFLASNDRMDKELTIAQMMGRFRMECVNNVGHILMEDDPKAVSEKFISFVNMFKIPDSV